MKGDDTFGGAPGRTPQRLLDAAAHAASRPRAPLLSPAARAALVVAAGLGALALVTLVQGLRGNAQALGSALVVAPATLLVVAGAALVALALREAVPGQAVAAGARAGAFATAFVLLAILAAWLDRTAGGPGGGLAPLACYRIGLAIALPAVALFGWLLARAYPLRPVSTAALGALGTGLLADAALHLTCPATNLEHTLFVHGGAVLTLTLAGATAGWAGSRLRSSRAP